MNAEGKTPVHLPATARPWTWLAPSAPLAAIALAAAGAELALLAVRNQNIFQFGWFTTLQISLFVAWLWLTATWIAWFAARTMSRILRRRGRVIRWAGWTAALALLAAVFLGYFASWRLYLLSGSFANLDVIEFVLLNSGESWLVDYVLRAETGSVVRASVGLAALLIGLPLAFRRLMRSRWQGPLGDTRVLAARRAIAWSALFVVPLTFAQLRPQDASANTIKLRRDGMANRLNPAVTLFFSWLDSTVAEPIRPVIEERELTPIAEHWTPPKVENPPSIVFIAIESLRHDVVNQVHQGEEIAPRLNELARNSLWLRRAYSQSTHSDYADVCIVSSLYPLRSRKHHYYRASDPWPKACIYDCLKPLGYATAIISSQNEKWGRMDEFLQTPGLDWFYDAERSDEKTMVDRRDTGFAHAIAIGELRAGRLDDAHTTDVAIGWIQAQVAAEKPFFLSMNFQSSHFPYDLPAGSPEPFQPAEMNFPASFTFYPREKADVVRNAYFNAVRYCDAQVGRLVDELRRLNRLENTILVVLGENGEAFWENGCISHAGMPMEPPLRVACVIHAPRFTKFRIEDYPTELIDVVPTIFGLVGWPAHPNFQGRDVLAQDRLPLESRLLFFHTENPLTRADAVLLAGRWKLILNRVNGREGFFDVQTDPDERRNLIQSTEHAALLTRLRVTLGEWRARQLAYYFYPTYYENYYPPRSPELFAPPAAAKPTH